MSTSTDAFASLGTHGLVRVAAATPPATVGDPSANAEAAIALAEQAHDATVDLVVYPELNLSSYAIDDLHLQDGMAHAVGRAVAEVARASAGLRPLLLLGAPLRHRGRLYNCAVAVHDGAVLGVVPKTYLPNYREYYEKRWFAPGAGVVGRTMDMGGHEVPFGTDLLFAADGLPDLVVGVEICEDMWAPAPPSTMAALAGATVLCNLSASNITIGKARDRALLCAAQSMRTMGAYVFSAAGPGESSTDMAWDGQGLVHELGEELAASTRFDAAAELLIADVDVGRVRQERMRTPTFNDTAVANGSPEDRYRVVSFAAGPPTPVEALHRDVARFPFVPADPERLDVDCYEAFNIQVVALERRMQAIAPDGKGARPVIGISGGIDSTHALIVAAKAMDRLGRPRSDIIAVTMPGFATSEGTKGNAWRLMEAMGTSAEEIDIRPAARQMLDDMGHPFADGEPTYDVTFENVQAGLRTDYLFRIANQRDGIVIGTGDLSELALGWCTYGVGDQMSHYAVNAGVPKTLIQHLIRWSVATEQFDDATHAVLLDVLDTEISPELVPAGDDGEIQSTQDRIGPYELHDFFLHHLVRGGLAPSKVAFLAWHAWRDVDAGRWPANLPADGRNAYDLPTIVRWLESFLHRFYGFSQFKRSAIPNGPKVSGAGALSPRSDWRAPSDGTAAPFIAELRAGVPLVG